LVGVKKMQNNRVGQPGCPELTKTNKRNGAWMLVPNRGWRGCTADGVGTVKVLHLGSNDREKNTPSDKKQEDESRGGRTRRRWKNAGGGGGGCVHNPPDRTPMK